MWMGEHAVLHNHPALVFAIDKRITVTLMPRQDTQIIIQSNLGRYQTDLSKLSDITVEKPFHFVLETILYFHHSLKAGLPSGFVLSLEADFEENIGFGSSAAVTVSVVAVFSRWMKVVLDDEMHIFEVAKTIIKKTQGGVGSGADVAASIFGGLIAYQIEPFSIQKINHRPPIVVIYSGSKTPTPEVIKYVEKNRREHPEIYDSLYSILKTCVQQTIELLKSDSNEMNWKKIGEIMAYHQQIMTNMKLTTPSLQHSLDFLNQEPKIWGAKISGSGLGDSVIGLGEIEDISNSAQFVKFKQKVPDAKHYSIAVEEQGLQYE